MTRRTHIRLPGLGRYVPPMGSQFVSVEAAGGLVLIAATIVALGLANSPWQQGYADFWHYRIQVGSGRWSVTETTAHWVNDGLMTVFFFVVGLEVKRELVGGELRDSTRARLPLIAALGGMAVPALLFVAINAGSESVKGWGIPMATDIAFALGVLALLGDRIKPGLKLFLLTLAVVDDIGAIIVIAVFYTSDVTPLWFLGALVCLVTIVAMQRMRIWSPWAYVIPAAALWLCALESGVHPTIAGVALGLLTPATRPGRPAVLENLEHRLHPISSFIIVPIFALANAGILLTRSSVSEALNSRVAWGVFVGLVLGKLIGVSGGAWIALRFGRARLPDDVSRADIVGAAALAGVGFTVSLFIADLSFVAGPHERSKFAILAASIASAALGLTLLARGTSSSSDP